MNGVEIIETHEGVKSRGFHKWTRMEDEKLLQILQEMSMDKHWKPEGSFKAGWVNEVHKRMQSDLEICSIEPKNIENRHKYLKEKYIAIKEMLMQTGVTWNSDSNMIQCDKSWYEEWVKGHKKASGLYNTCWPYYETMDLIYSRDRATGNVAEPIRESISDESPIPSDIVDLEDDEETILARNASMNGGSKRKSDTSNVMKLVKKKRGDDPLTRTTEKFSQSVTTFMSDLSTGISSIADAWKEELSRDVTKAKENEAVEQELRQNILDDLKSIDGLDFEEVLDACPILRMKKDHYGTYKLLNPTEKKQFVKLLLRRFGASSTSS